MLLLAMQGSDWNLTQLNNINNIHMLVRWQQEIESDEKIGKIANK